MQSCVEIGIIFHFIKYANRQNCKLINIYGHDTFFLVSSAMLPLQHLCTLQVGTGTLCHSQVIPLIVCWSVHAHSAAY